MDSLFGDFSDFFKYLIFCSLKKSAVLWRFMAKKYLSQCYVPTMHKKEHVQIFKQKQSKKKCRKTCCKKISYFPIVQAYIAPGSVFFSSFS